jgi:NUMOD3 motif/HNH endonuclease
MAKELRSSKRSESKIGNKNPMFGISPWNKGIHLPIKMRKKISESHKGERNFMFGKHHSEETRVKISESVSGEKHPMFGKHLPEITRLKISNKKKGSNHHNWKGGVTPINVSIRNSSEYKIWRTLVFQRDHYTCQKCGEIGGNLCAHHIRPFSKYPLLRFDINNGQTLCFNCHKRL